jgi:chaperonin cofactor prefoldin
VSFTVEDFHDLIELLAQHPEWRAELRRHVLSDELLELPALVRQLVEAYARAEVRFVQVEERLTHVEERLDRLEASVQALVEAQIRAEARFAQVEERLDRLEASIQTLVEVQIRAEARLDRLETSVQALIESQGRAETMLGRFQDRLGDIDGRVLEADFARRGPSVLSSIARRLRVIEPGSLADLLDDAVDDGQLTGAERETILLTDVVLSGRSRNGDDPIYLLVEVSGRIDVHDVERAVERASLLGKLGRPVVPVVAGRRIDADVAEAATDQGVWYALGGRVTAPRSA